MKWFVSIFILLAGIVALLLVAPSFIDWSQYKAQITEQAKKVTGFDVVVNGGLSLSILPSPRFYIEDVEVRNPIFKDPLLAKMKRLDVEVAAMPLLSRSVEVKSVTLQSPDITVRQDQNGTYNFMPPQLVRAAEDVQDAVAQPGRGGQDFAVSFDQISIEGGSFKSYDPSGKQVIDVDNADLNVKAGSLQGPFEFDGSLRYGDMPVSFKGKTGALDAEAQSASLNLDAAAQVNGQASKLNFAGVVSYGEKPGAQGEMKASIADAGGQGAASITGILTADAKEAVIRNADIVAGQHKAKGSLDVEYSPMAVNANLNGEGFKDGVIKVSPGAGGASVFDVNFATIDLSPFGFPHQAKGLKFKGSYSPNSLNISSLVVDDILFSSLNVKGDIKDIKGLSGIDLNGSANMRNIPELGKALNVDASALPKDLKSASVQASAKGSMAALQTNSVIKAMGLDVIVSGMLTNPTTNLAVDNLAVQVKHPNMAKAMQQFTPGAPDYVSLAKPLDFYSDVTISGQSYALNNIKADLAGASLKGALKYNGGGAKPSLSGDLTFGNLRLASGKNTSSSGSGGSSSGGGTSSGGGAKWSSAPLEADWLHDFTADLSVKASSIYYEGWDLANPSLAFKLNNGVMSISDLKAGLYGGSFAATGSLSSPAKGKPVSLDGNAIITKVNMEPLVRSLAGNRLVKGKGLVSLNTDIKGAGSSMKSLVGSLAGQGSVLGSDIVIDGIDVNRFVRALSDDAKPGDTLTHLWKGAGKGGSTSFETLDGAYTITNGIINIQKLLLDGPRSSIDTTGAINLPNWTLQTAHAMSVKDRDDVPPFTMKISGSLDNPANTFAQGAINDYLQRKLQRKLGKALEGKLGDELDKSPLGGVLKGILGGGQQPNPVPDPAPEASPEPANDNSAPAAEPKPEAQPKEIDPEEAVKGLLKGLF